MIIMTGWVFRGHVPTLRKSPLSEVPSLRPQWADDTWENKGNSLGVHAEEGKHTALKHLC